MSFLLCQANQSPKSQSPANPRRSNPPRRMLSRRSLSPKAKGLRLLKETLQATLVQKKPAPDKVENLAKEYLAELREVDVTFEKGTAVLEKYRAKYPELASYIREIVPGERRIEIRQPGFRTIAGSRWPRSVFKDPGKK